MIKKVTVSLMILALSLVTLSQVSLVNASHKPSHKKPTVPLTHPRGHGHGSNTSLSGIDRFVNP